MKRVSEIEIVIDTSHGPDYALASATKIASSLTYLELLQCLEFRPHPVGPVPAHDER